MIDMTTPAASHKAPLPVTPIGHLEEFCQQIGIGQPARRLLRPGLTPWEYFGVLLARQKYPDAIRFLAHLLPQRQAVWWACLCLRWVVGTNLGPKQTAALETFVRWVLDPSPPHCRAAEVAGKAAGFGTTAGCLAMSVSWSGQSATPPDQPAVPPDPMFTANMAAGVVLNVAAEGPPSEFETRERLFLSMGMGVAAGELPRNSAAGGPLPSVLGGRDHAAGSVRGDMHICPAASPIPHGGGTIIAPGCPLVLIGGQPAARQSDLAICIGSGAPDMIVMGSPMVLIGGLPAARVLDPTLHGGHILMGFPMVLIGP